MVEIKFINIITKLLFRINMFFYGYITSSIGIVNRQQSDLSRLGTKIVFIYDFSCMMNKVFENLVLSWGSHVLEHFCSIPSH